MWMVWLNGRQDRLGKDLTEEQAWDKYRKLRTVRGTTTTDKHLLIAVIGRRFTPQHFLFVVLGRQHNVVI